MTDSVTAALAPPVQLCINFTNERLHGHYLNCTARAEGALYKAEGLRWEMPTPEANEAIISLLDGDPVNSLFPLLDSQCQLRNPSDKGFVVSLFQVCDLICCVTRVGRWLHT